MNRATDWLIQASAFLGDAERSHQGQSYYLSCFLSQQAAEFALKSFCEFLKVRCWGHELLQIVTALEKIKKVLIPDNIKDCCAILTKFYIGTRYPDAYTTGTPAKLFTKTESEHAISCAKEVYAFAREEIL
nr:HEPN domain-containing protein [Candidatus Sigynarchaeum springense]MDO8118926.1 HEPN domain-containing protein [Candidatus Sigynarchaeota archaeon]